MLLDRDQRTGKNVLAIADSVVYAVGCVVTLLNQERILVCADAMGADLLKLGVSILSCNCYRQSD